MDILASWPGAQRDIDWQGRALLSVNTVALEHKKMQRVSTLTVGGPGAQSCVFGRLVPGENPFEHVSSHFYEWDARGDEQDTREADRALEVEGCRKVIFYASYGGMPPCKTALAYASNRLVNTAGAWSVRGWHTWGCHHRPCIHDR